MFEQISLFDGESEQHSGLIKSNEWNWKMSEYPKTNGLKVFSCFACGGGSTMGYKLAGCEVVGCLEIDKRVNDVYVKNHHPKYNYLMDIREFNQLEDLPQELYNLDVLDGSPPCTSFSIAGDREKGWGKAKKFKEGQKLQTLDDLLFVFIDTVAKLRPKVVIMENVQGLLMGKAYKYVEKVLEKFNSIGYKCIYKLLKGEEMGVPQKRHRVFFIATRLDFDLYNINLDFNYAPVVYKDYKGGKGYDIIKKSGDLYQTLLRTQYGDKTLFNVLQRENSERKTYYQEQVLWDDSVCNTIRGDSGVYRGETKTLISKEELFAISTFPQDFEGNSNSFWHLEYICGMSVPPLMIKRVITRLIESGIFYEEENKNE